MSIRRNANPLWLGAGWAASLVLTSLITWKTASLERSASGTVLVKEAPRAEAEVSEGANGLLQRLQELLVTNAKLNGDQKRLKWKLALLEEKSRSLEASKQERQRSLEAEATLRLDRLLLAKEKGSGMFAGFEAMLDHWLQDDRCWLRRELAVVAAVDDRRLKDSKGGVAKVNVQGLKLLYRSGNDPPWIPFSYSSLAASRASVTSSATIDHGLP